MAGTGLLRNPVCRVIIKVGRLIPVLAILGIIGFSYYVYCFQTVPAFATRWYVRALLYVVFHLLLVLFLASYFVTVLSPVPRIPEKYFLPKDVLIDLWEEKSESGRNDILARYTSQNNIVVLNTSATDGPRFCPACKCIKPDRSHHCSICSNRYDHHCPWVNNCVHHRNYKAFLLFLFYGLLLCLFALATSLDGFISFWKGNPLSHEVVDKFGVIFLPFLAFLFGLSIACLFFYHVYLVCRNRTTIEQWNPPHFEEGVDRNAYNLGCGRNFRQIFGAEPFWWPLPVTSTHGDGLSFALRRRRTLHELLDQEPDEEGGRSLLGVSV